MPNDQKKTDGVTLVEVLVASVLLLMTFGALVISFTRAQHMSSAMNYSTEAMNTARSELEELRFGDYFAIASFTNIPLTDTILATVGGLRHCNVITSTNDYKDVTISITWLNPGRTSASSISLSTLICNTNSF